VNLRQIGQTSSALPRGAHLRAALAFTLALLCSCQTDAVRPASALWTPAPNVTRVQTIAIAEAYAKHRWRADETNVFHGKDANGITVDTPDESYKPKGGVAGWWKPGGWNIGIPYKWGGFDTPQEFNACVSCGKCAGDVFTVQKRELNNSAVSQHTTGVDCSGFISRCWRLPAPVSTYEIHKCCDPLPSLEELKPGDVVNKENEHISLFVAWHDPGHSVMQVYDVGCPPHWKVLKHGVYTSWLREHGYKPWRYQKIID
jgi:cell wall-associated NlpC family hydrolase